MKSLPVALLFFAFIIMTLLTSIASLGVRANSNSSPSDGHSFLTRGVARTVLPNGLTVLLKEDHDKPVVSTVLWYRVGSRNEELGQTGKSHFLEHMLFKGTDRYKKGDIDLITLKNGGANNAFTWLDFTAYYFSFASDRWQAALEIESNRMRNTNFAPEEFEPEKKVVEEELHIGLDGPWEPLENEVYATAFRQHPYHWPTVGWIDDLERTTAADMKAYYDKWYHPRNATLVIVGDFKTDEILPRVKDLFGPIPTGPAAAPLKIVEPPQRGEKRVVVRKATPVERLFIGYHVPAVGDEDVYTLRVVEALLSTGKASRLYQNLVDKDQSVTVAHASYEDHIDPSLFYLQAELKPGFKLADVEQAIYAQVEELKREPVPAAEMARAKSQIESDLVLGNEDPLQQAILLGQFETIATGERVPEQSRGYRYLDNLIDKVNAVTADDVKRIANKYFGQENRTVGYLVDDGSTKGAGGAGPAPARSAGGSSQRSSMRRSGRLSVAGDESGSPAQRLANRVSFRSRKSASEPQFDSSSVAPAEPATGAHPDQQGPKIDAEQFVLKNGLKVILSENHSTPSVAIKAVVNAGSRFEPGAKAGLAHLTGELLDEGTRSRSSQQIAEAVESVGAKLGTWGEYQSSGVQVALLTKDLRLGLVVTADLLMNAEFPVDRVKQHVERTVAQIKSRADVPSVLASDTLNEIIFKGSPRRWPAIGYESTVNSLTRQDMLDFYHKYYEPNNTVLVIVGDIDKAQAKKMVEEAFGKWNRAEGLTLPAVQSAQPQTAAVDKFVNANKEQVNIFIGRVGINRTNPDYYSLLVFDTILGSSPGFTSRIPRILRDEQGLAYTTYSNITGSAGIDPGRFVAYLGTSPENLDKGVDGLRREIARIVAEPVSAEELNGAKDYLTGSFVFDFVTNAQVAQFLVDAETYGLGYGYLTEYPQKVRAVTIQDVARVAKKYLDPKALTTVVVGPVDERGHVIQNKPAVAAGPQ